VRDWLKLIVGDEQFDSTTFDLPRLDAPAARTRGWGTRAISVRRPVATPTADWATSIVPMRTEVPG
jgi:hypothetical protein